MQESQQKLIYMYQILQKVSKYCRNMTGMHVSVGNRECFLPQHTTVFLEERTGLDNFYSEANVPVIKEAELSYLGNIKVIN